jgi:hypothetical protein
MKQILCNRIQTPDGTILISYNRHDFKTHLDKNGYEYMVDGGDNYLRRNIVQEAPYKELSVYDDSPYEEIRKVLYRGGRGKDGTEELKYVPLNEMSNEWVKAVITYEEGLRPDNKYLKYYRQEVEYRKKNNISIED